MHTAPHVLRGEPTLRLLEIFISRIKPRWYKKKSSIRIAAFPRFSIGRSCCLGRFVTCYVFFLPFFASLLQLRHLPLFLLVCFPTILRGQSEKLFLLRPRITLLYELFYIFLWLLFWHQRSKSFVIFLSIFHFSALATYTTDCNCYTSS